MSLSTVEHVCYGGRGVLRVETVKRNGSGKEGGERREWDINQNQSTLKFFMEFTTL